MCLDLRGVNFFIETPDGNSVEIKGTQETSIISDQVVDSDFDFGKEISGTFTYEEPENVKDLKKLGFSDQKAWDIYFRKGESWKQS